VVFYAIEKQDSEWVIYVHGAAILRCARSDVALEIVKVAQARLGNEVPEPAPGYALPGEALPRVRWRESGA
jgi:hypothetical protein